MLILHASALNRRLIIWGECPASATPPEGRRTGARAKDNRSPYDPGGAAIASAISAAGVTVRTARKAGDAYVAWLPTMAGVPVTSSPLIAEPPVLEDVTLVPWGISAIPLDHGQAIDLLGRVAAGDSPAAGIFWGKSVLWWAAVLRHAGSLVARQKYLPAVEQADSPSGWRAGWRSVATGPDSDALVSLAAGMPHCGRAMAYASDSAPEIPPTSVVSEMVDAWVDYLVRTASAEAGPTGVSVHDRWTHALTTPDGALADAAELYARWREWTRPIVVLANAPFRLCFRLEEPPDEEGGLFHEDEVPNGLERTRITVKGTVGLSQFRTDEGAGTSPEPCLSKTSALRPTNEFVGCPGECPTDNLCPERSSSLEKQSAAAITEGVGSSSFGLGGEATRADVGSWALRYLLQAVDDPSLFIPLDRAWTPLGAEADALAQRSFSPREYLLTSLGQAARVCAPVHESMRGSMPAGCALATGEAYEFLSDQAWLLEQMGFGVQLPRFWTRRGSRAKLTARAHAKSPGMQAAAGLTLDAVIDFEWQVAVGDHDLSIEELDALAAQKAGLVKIRGQWVEVDQDEMQSVLRMLKNRTGQVTARDLVRMALGASTAAGGVSVAGVDATGWIGDVLRGLTDHAQLAPAPPPPGFMATLRPYQERGCSWLNFLRQWGFGACLADDMGLGKTIQVLGHIAAHRHDGEQRPTLVVCPTSVVGNWEREAARFVPEIPVMVHHGTTRRRGPRFAEDAARHGIVLSSYALLHRDYDQLQAVAWAAVILDEAQNIKNPGTQQSRAARALGTAAAGRIALTGTPVENHVGDLWSVMDFLNPGFLGTQAQFKRTFFQPIQTGAGPEAADALKKITGPFILRRLKSDKSIIADLPEKNEMKVYCNLTREQASLYEAVVRDAEEKLQDKEGIGRKGLVLAVLSRLKQVCNHPAQFLGDNSAISGRSGKLARLQEMLEEVLSVDERALIFTQFFEMGDIIRRHLQETLGQETLFLHGGTSKDNRDRMVQRFQSPDGPRLFILSLKAGGTGLTLTAANHVFHFDRWWNPAVENQATDRAYRIGQTRQVQVHKFLCAGTLEERIDEMIESKQKLAANVIGTGEDWLTELSTSELKQLFTLRRDAIGD
ncbi:MAG: DEAD/DEAH box helicase [Capsulimonadaceae bacterium]